VVEPGGGGHGENNSHGIRRGIFDFFFLYIELEKILTYSECSFHDE